MIKGLKRHKTTNVTVFEYGLLSASAKAAEKDNVEAISEDAFEYLKSVVYVMSRNHVF